MCGIGAIVSFKGSISENELLSINTSLRHRGPDEQGIWLNNEVGFAHTRLSIIDIESGKQPMVDADSGNVIVFNGEIYNYSSLRDELIALGQRFQTNSDTEVILKAYAVYGERCVERLRGMYAFAIYRAETKSLFVSVDPFGMKSVYYFLDDEHLIIASELHSVQELLLQKKIEISRNHIVTFLSTDYIPYPDTTWDTIKKLSQGATLSYSNHKVVVNSVSVPIIAKTKICGSESSHLHELRKILCDSVSSHLVSDVDYGLFLSGGVDSTLISKFAVECLGSSLKCFTIGFKGYPYSEVNYASVVAKKYGLEHYIREIEAQDIPKIARSVVRKFSDPCGDSSMIPTWAVSKLASEHVKMVLSGDGGDELFAGYSIYKPFSASETRFSDVQDCLRNVQEGSLRGLLRSLVSFFKPKTHLNHLWYERWMGLRCADIDITKTIVKTWSVDCLTSFEEVSRKIYNEVKDGVSYAQTMDLHLYLPALLLRKVDIASMANSLEVRTPFLDSKVLQFSQTLPTHLKFRYLQKYGYQGKYLLKKILEEDFDRDFIYRNKFGFGLPANAWFLESAVIQNDIIDSLQEAKKILSSFLKYDELLKIIKRFDTHCFQFTWKIYMLALWAIEFNYENTSLE